jgi:preprotein translocase SecE subunit
MGRAARREQERASRRQTKAVPSRGLPSVSTSAPLAAGSTRAAVGPWWQPRWAMDIISELRKVTWPTRQETMNLTIVVIVISLLFGLVLGAADFAFSWGVEHTLLR